MLDRSQLQVVSLTRLCDFLRAARDVGAHDSMQPAGARLPAIAHRSLNARDTRLRGARPGHVAGEARSRGRGRLNRRASHAARRSDNGAEQHALHVQRAAPSEASVRGGARDRGRNSPCVEGRAIDQMQRAPEQSIVRARASDVKHAGCLASSCAEHRRRPAARHPPRAPRAPRR